MALPLVLIPGLLCTGELFSRQAEALGDIAEATVADATGADSMDELAEAVLAAAPERFALAGLSMGGYVAFEIMRRAPRRVAALALLDTTARPDTAEQSEARARLVALAGEQGVAVAVEELLPRLIAESRLDDDEPAGTVRRMAEAVGVEAFARQQTAIINRPDSRLTLPTIACPTLVLVGDRDKLTPPPLSEEMAGAIPEALLEVVSHCGHLSALERPDEVSAALRRLLGRV